MMASLLFPSEGFSPAGSTESLSWLTLSRKDDSVVESYFSLSSHARLFCSCRFWSIPMPYKTVPCIERVDTSCIVLGLGYQSTWKIA